MGTPESGEIFRESMKQAIKVNTALTDVQRRIVESELSFPVVFKKTNPVAHDHQVIAAFREIARQVYDSCFKVNRIRVPTLAIGSAFREFSKYSTNNYIHYYFHDSESKDYDRTIRWFLESFVDKLVSKSSKRSKLVNRDQNGEKPLVTKTYESFKQLLIDYKQYCKIPDCLKTTLTTGYEALLLEDSFYNLKPEDYKELFKSTGANVAYGYGLLPLELNFPEMPASQNYRISVEGGKAHLDFSYSNGYCHDEVAWSTLLRNPVMNFDTFALVVEIVSYAGPMAVFKIIKVNKSGETVSRALALPRKKQYVKILDLVNSTSADGSLKRLRYFSVFANEYFETLNYCLSIDRRSLSLANTMTFVRRRAGGVSLISKELLAPWNLQSRDFYSFSLAVYIQARLVVEHSDNIESLYSKLSWTWAKTLIWGSTDLFRAFKWFFTANNIAEKLVLFGTDELKQRHRITITNPQSVEYNITLDEPYVEKVHACPICAKLDGQLGDQIIECNHKAHEVTISMTDKDLETLRAQLADDDNDAPGLKNVKEAAKKNLPATGFSHSCRFHYIKGGPGTGKSYIIRKLATKFDLVYAPFTKLMSDYRNVRNDFGEKYDLPFATIHRGLNSRCISTIFIDEFTSLPMEYIKLVISINRAEDVYIVGDTEQTRVQQDEGTYIGDEIDINQIPKHTLLRNFRNPKKTVALLNKNFGYNMQAMSDVDTDIIVIGPNERLSEDLKKKPWTQMAMSYATLGKCSLERSQTVRKYQGSTADYVMLNISEADADFIDNSNIAVVALSRHVQQLVIKHDGSDTANNWLARYNITTQVEPEHYKTHTPVKPCEDISFEHKDTENYIKHNFKTKTLEGIVRVDEDFPIEPKTIKTLINKKITFILSNFSSFFHSIFSSRVIWGYLLWGLLFKIASVFETNSLLLSVFPLITTELKLLIVVVVNRIVFFQHKNFDIHILMVHLLIKTITEPFNNSFLHFTSYYDTINSYTFNTSKPILDIYWTIYISAKINYFSRFFCIDYWGPKTKILTVFLFGHLFMWLFSLPIFNIDYLCDFFSSPTMLIIVLLCRFKNFRVIWKPFGFSYDPNELSFGKIIDHEIFLNLSSGDYYFKNQQYYDALFRMLPVNIRKFFEQLPIEEVKPKNPIEAAGKDSHELLDTLLPAIATQQTNECHNNIGSLEINEDLYTGTVNPVELVSPVNLKHKPSPTVTKGYKFAPGSGNSYYKRFTGQLLQVLSGRYFNKKPKAKKSFDHDAELLVTEMVQEFMTECVGAINYQDAELEKIAAEFTQSATQKKYESQFKGFDNMDINVIRFHLKDIYKPYASKHADELKVGQGISAWNKDAQVEFGVAARFANYLFAKVLQPHVIYDNRITPAQMKEKIALLMSNIPKTAVNGITDQKMFDSFQNEFTQAIEKEMLRALKFSDLFIDQYYRFRKNYKIISGSISGTSGFEKTSGEPMTLLMNTIVSAVIGNYLLRGQGPFMLAIKGDDGFKRQCSLKVSNERVEKLAQYSTLEIKLEISDNAEFCGYVITDSLFVESIPRKLHKISSHFFRDYTHFAQYQQSLRDFIADYEHDQLFTAYIQANVQMYKKFELSSAEVYAMYDAIKSLAHIDQEQFYKTFNYTEINPIIKTADGGHTIDSFVNQPVVHTHQHNSSCKSCMKISCDLAHPDTKGTTGHYGCVLQKSMNIYTTSSLHTSSVASSSLSGY